MKKLSMQGRSTLEAYIFISPWLIGLVVLFIFPFFSSIRLSFSEFKLANYQMTWDGLTQYRKLFIEDTVFIDNLWPAIKDTLINTPIILIFSLVIAIMVNKDIRGRAFFRGAFFLPVLLGTGYVMTTLLNNGVGDAAVSVARQSISPDGILAYLGADLVNTLNEFLARITQIFWKSGVQILLFLSGLQGISPALYESSKCDGATEWEMFWKITLPLISPVILLNFVYTMIDSFTDSSNPIVSYINSRFNNGDLYPYCAAISLVYFVFVFVMVIAVFGILNRFTVDLSDNK